VPVIFAGTVADLGPKEVNSKTSSSYSQQTRFIIDEPFKGASTENIVVKAVHQQSSCPSFLPDFTIGEHYLVLALQDEQGNAFVSDCTATRKLEDAAQFLSELRELRHGTGPTYIFGTISRTRIFPNGVRVEDLERYSPLPLSGVKVVVSSPENNQTVLTDQRGFFVAPLLKGGTYRVSADLPWYSNREGLNREIDLEDHDCANVSLWTRYRFLFRGRVVDIHGMPLRGVSVELLSADTLDSFDRRITNDRGEYELSASEPGDYLIAENWDEPPSDESPFATVLYPGVSDVDAATRLHTEEAGALELSDFRLETPRKCAMQIQIEGPNGKPDNEARVLAKYFSAQFWHPVADVNPSGMATVTVTGPGYMYIVGSHPLSGPQELRSEVKLIDSCPAKTIRLRLTQTINVE
jgi:hypothetical protein